jgi:transcriptional regulator with XRE-family HTH domain
LTFPLVVVKYYNRKLPSSTVPHGPSIIWDSEDDEQGNYHHIVTEGHGITEEEVDEVLRAHHSEATTSRTTGNPICFGWTTTGKYLAVVFEESCDDPLMLYPITAYEAPVPRGEDDMTSKRNKPTASGPDQPSRPARTAEDLARYKAIRERFQREKPSLEELVSSGEYNEPLPMGEHLSIRQAVFALRKAREAAGLSLADVAGRTGIDKAALSRIETGQHPNPTVSTLCRYAHALGKRWKWVLEDEARPGRDPTTGVRRRRTRMDDQEFGTTEDYRRAFQAVQAEGIPDNHLALLQAHYNAPEHTATWAQLAAAVGYANFNAVNLQYGKFAERVARQLGLSAKPLDPNGNPWWTWALVRWAEGRDPESGHTRFVLRRPAVEALQQLGIVPAGAAG